MSIMDDLSPEQVGKIEKNMQKGAFSEAGFLDSGEHLMDVIEKDARTLQELGITHKQIGDRLESILGKAARLEQLAQRGQLKVEKEPAGVPPKNMWSTLRKMFTHADEKKDGKKEFNVNVPYVENRYRVSQVAFFGLQECPFIGPDGKSCPQMTSCDYLIEQVGAGSKVSFSGLLIHLIRDHHFFEGSVHYRLDPKQVVSTLDIQPGHDYAPVYSNEKYWRREQGTAQNYDDLERSEKLAYHAAITSAEQVIKLSEKTCLYLWNGICVSVSDRDYLLSKELMVADGYWPGAKIEEGVWVYKPYINAYVEI